METVPSGRERRTKLLIGSLASIAMLFVVWSLAGRTPISGLKSFRSDSNIVPVTVRIFAPDQEVLAPNTSRFQPPPSAQAQASPQTSPTPHSVPSKSANPPLELGMFRRTPALSLHFHRGQEVLKWMDENPGAKSFLTSPAVTGMMNDVLETMRVRTDDLDLSSGVVGLTIEKLAREALSANGVIRFDPYDGPRGFVLSFERKNAPLCSRLLPPLVAALSRRTFDVPTLASPVEEITLGRQSLYLTEEKGLIYAASGLKALLNALDQRLEPAAKENVPALRVSLHGESIFNRLLPLLTGRDSATADWGFSFPSPSAPAQLDLRLSPVKAFSALSPKIAQGVFAAIPEDSFAVFAASFQLPPDMSPEKWNTLATGGSIEGFQAPEEGGFAMIWDLAGPVAASSTEAESSTETVTPTQIGVVVSMPLTDAQMKLGDYFNGDAVELGECGGGTVWIAATNEILFTRMKEACDRQSKSFLNWFESGRLDGSPQLFLAVNPSVGLREAQEIGLSLRESETAGDEASQPEWKKSYEKAVTQAASRADQIFSSLPIFIYSGQGVPSGSVLKGVVQWNNRT